jgi:hypothetical protein
MSFFSRLKADINPFDGKKKQPQPQPPQQRVNVNALAAALHGIQTGGRDVGGAIAAGNRALNTAGLGVQRSAIGTAQGVSGLYDLASRGKGTNRVSKKLDQYAKNVDKTGQKAPFPALYKGGQAIGDAASLVTGGGEVKLGAKALPYSGKVADVAGHVAAPINRAVDNGAAKLATKGS